ncbi:hypothetical protein GCM10010842_34830 [Deinococcus daejeonensis]|uniref:Uncharacterized protein n=1 Tax=Deinococcus daejeonensis TaxID=1007098 RepID=A0ABQ2JFF4_9DEIO|nr:hypothetical protein GCM10010842_34830 [Deinococcus daejeonensis]
MLECSPSWEARGIGIKGVWDALRQSLKMTPEPGSTDPDGPADAAVGQAFGEQAVDEGDRVG